MHLEGEVKVTGSVQRRGFRLRLEVGRACDLPLAQNQQGEWGKEGKRRQEEGIQGAVHVELTLGDNLQDQLTLSQLFPQELGDLLQYLPPQYQRGL